MVVMAAIVRKKSSAVSRHTSNPFDGVKVFSATMARDRDGLGDQITAWIQANPTKLVVDKIVTQSSDNQFHCIAITLFYRELS